MKFVELVPVPAEVVTEILPVVAPLGTWAKIFVLELTKNCGAPRPLNLTDVTPEKPLPLIVTVVPTGPLDGLKLETTGALPPPPLPTVKFVVLVPVPAGVVTEIGPVVAPVGTLALICELELANHWVAPTPLNLTEDTLLKLLPLMVTIVPTFPLVGLKLVIVGPPPPPLVTVNEVALVAVPFAVVTEMAPLVAAPGTVAAICVAWLTVKVAAVPLNLTDVAPVKFVPVITTLVPAGPLVGVKLVIVGAAPAVEQPGYLKAPTLVFHPSELVAE